MPIKILKGSFSEHRTLDSISTQIFLRMNWRDYYAGIGDLVHGSDETNIIQSNYILPYEGDSYGIQFQTNYLSSLTLTDITMEPISARSATTIIDLTLQDLDKEINVTYTYSNDGASDTKRLNEASSWKIRYETTLENLSLDSYVSPEADGIKKYYWPHKYLTELNPDVKLTKTNDVGEEEEVDYGPYVDIDGHDANKMPVAIQQLYIDTVRDTIPIVQKRVPNTVATVTAYATFVRGANLSSIVGYVNSVDFINNIYAQKELAIAQKNKLPGFQSNDWFEIDDTGLWQFIDWTMQDLSNGFFEYEFFFEYNSKGWNRYKDADVDIDLKLYPTINFYDAIFLGMDKILPNSRENR